MSLINPCLRSNLLRKQAHEIKLLILGDPAVGKTSTVIRFATSSFEREYKPTLGTEIFVKELSVDEEKIILQVWDLAGSPLFSGVRKGFYKNSDAAFLVCDLTRPNTLESLKGWTAETFKALSYHPVYLLVGNKVDLTTERKVTMQQLQVSGQKLQVVEIVEASARTGLNVNEAFYTVAKYVLDRKRWL
ncbi:MAG TPA: Rab family GTPase [Candidatus Hodarchaeales archaeon]|nr:Rab family GTPase [Candidatus Hodarchaeales archaeon]